MTRTYKQAIIGVVLLVIGGLIASTSDLTAQTLALTAVWMLMGMGSNIVTGYAGPISLGQGAFFGLTSFITSQLFAANGVTPYVGMAAGIVCSVALAGVFGLITLRLSGLYFGLATLTLPLIMGTLTIYFGYTQILRPYHGNSIEYFQFDSSIYYYIAGAILVAIGLFCTAFIANSRMGLYFVSIRENPRAAEASGVPTNRYKVYAFMIAALFASVAGGLYSQLSFVFDPNDVYSPLTSVQALLVAMVGGPGTVLGPVIGALIVIPAGRFASLQFAEVSGLDHMIYAVLLLVVAFWFRRGVYPLIEDLIRYLRKRWTGRGNRSDDGGSAPGEAPGDPELQPATGSLGAVSMREGQ